jgi:ankyrin repeat protein
MYSDVKEAIELLLPLSGDTIALDDDGWTPLHVAALNGRLKEMEVLHNHDGEMLDYRSYNGSTPLHVIHNASAAARWLLDQGANVNACTEKGATPLIIAVEKECEDVVEVLISRRADIRIFDDSNKTALHHVFETFWRLNNSILSCLLNQDPAAANHKNHDGDTVLHLAVKSSFKVVDMVLNKSPSEKRFEIDANIKNNSGDTPLLLAVKKHSQDSSMLPTIQALLKFGVNTELSDSTGDTALLIATNHKHEDAMEELLKKAAVDVPDKEGNTPLLLAVRSDQENIVKLLLRHKASPQIRNKNNETALSISVKGKNKDILKLLSDREHHSSTKNQLPTPLHIYAVDGDLESLQELVEKENPDVNAIGGAFQTALQAAARSLWFRGNRELPTQEWRGPGH